MQVGQQISDLLLVEHLAVGRHLVAAEPYHVRHAIIIGRHATFRQKLALENAFHAGTLPAAGGVGGVAAVAVVVIDTAACGLLRIEAEFSITLAALDIAAGDNRDEDDGQYKQFQIADFGFQNVTSWPGVLKCSDLGVEVQY